MDGAIWAATLITLVSCVSFVSAWEDRSSGAPALIIGVLLAGLGIGGTFLSRKYTYTNGERLSASIAAIAVPLIILGLLQLTGIWPHEPSEPSEYADLKTGEVHAINAGESQHHYEHRSLPLAYLAVAIPTLIVGLIVGLKLRAGVAIGVAFGAFVVVVLMVLDLADISIDSAWVPGSLTVVAAVCAFTAERKDRALATWLHPYVIIGVPSTLAAIGLWDEPDPNFGLSAAVFAVLAVIAGALAVLLTRTLYAAAAGAALVAAEIQLFTEVIHNPALALTVSLLTGLGLVVGIVVAVVKRGGIKGAKPNPSGP